MLSPKVICHFPGSGGATTVPVQLIIIWGERVRAEFGKKVENGEYSWKCEDSWMIVTRIKHHPVGRGGAGGRGME